MTTIGKGDALRRLQACIGEAAQDIDPAPWFDANFKVENWGGDANQWKIQAATKVALICGLRTGDLVGIAEVDGEIRAVPSWAWHFASWESVQVNWPVRLPDELAEWRGVLVEKLDASRFEEWLATFSFRPLAPDDLPHSSEPTPDLQLRKLLPETGTVTLSECVSWVAWRYALSGPELMAAIDQGEFGPLGERQMRDAFAQVLAKAKSTPPKIELFGRYQPIFRGSKEAARQLGKSDLIDFARFNAQDESLERGKGFAWDASTSDPAFSLPDAFVDIEAPREQLLTAFPEAPSDLQTYSMALESEWAPLLAQAIEAPIHEVPRFLTLGQASAWLVHRTTAAIVAITKVEGTDRGNDSCAVHMFYFSTSPHREIEVKCLSGVEELCFGRRNGSGDLLPIPPGEWDGAQLTHIRGDWSLASKELFSPHSAGRTIWSGVRLDRDRLFGLWPSEVAVPEAAKPPTEPSAEVSQSSERTPISDASLRHWFAQRVKEFEGRRAPVWQACHAAAKNAFPQHRITREKLQTIRKEAAPDWGPGRR